MGFADGAGVGVGGVGRAHDVSVAGDGVFAFKDLHDDGARDHEGNELTEEAAFCVDGVKAFGLGLGEVKTLLSDDAQASAFDHGVDGAGEVAAGGVGLEYGECAGDGHFSIRFLGLMMGGV